jgi:hypothetical protein
MNHRPGWIQLLYKRSNAGHALHTGFLLNITNENIAEIADSHIGGREQLREVALTELDSDDSQILALSLLFLGIAGQPEDFTIIKKFVDHPSDLIQKAARACRFELLQARNKSENKDLNNR